MKITNLTHYDTAVLRSMISPLPVGMAPPVRQELIVAYANDLDFPENTDWTGFWGTHIARSNQRYRDPRLLIATPGRINQIMILLGKESAIEQLARIKDQPQGVSDKTCIRLIAQRLNSMLGYPTPKVLPDFLPATGKPDKLVVTDDEREKKKEQHRNVALSNLKYEKFRLQTQLRRYEKARGRYLKLGGREEDIK